MRIEPPFSRAARLFYPDSPGSPICKTICCSICFRSTAFILQTYFSILSFHDYFIENFQSNVSPVNHTWHYVYMNFLNFEFFNDILYQSSSNLNSVCSTLCIVSQYFQLASWEAKGDSLALLVVEYPRQNQLCNVSDLYCPIH